MISNRAIGPILAASLVVFACACKNSDPALFGDTLPPASSSVSLQRDVQPIFTARCAIAGCHTSGDAQAGLVLAAGRLFDPGTGVVSVSSTEQPDLLRVAPLDPANSYLMRKITGTQSLGDRMPLGDAPLSATEVDVIRRWIADGAKND